MENQYDIVVTVATFIAAGAAGMYEYFRRKRANGIEISENIDGQAVAKRINYKEAYADLVEMVNDIRHDTERLQQANEILTRTVDEDKHKIEGLEQKALEYKIARDALEARQDKELAAQAAEHATNTDKLLDRLHKQTVDYTTTSLQQSSLINDLSTQLAGAKTALSKMQDDMKDFKQELDKREAARQAIEKQRQSCQEQINELRDQNGKLRADIEILQRKLGKRKSPPDTDDLDVEGKAA